MKYFIIECCSSQLKLIEGDFNMKQIEQTINSIEVKIRATKEEKQLLEDCCEISGMTQREVVIDGIKRVYADVKK